MARPDSRLVAEQVRAALGEDIGGGDLTASLVPAGEMAEARVLAREAGVMCGRDWVVEVFRQLDPRIDIAWSADDADTLRAGQTVCVLRGEARPLLSGERVALNFLQTLSATATIAASYVAAVAGNKATVLDTRKTIPGLRLAQKYAVRCGGGENHRVGLYDAILIKENHIRAAGSIDAALRAAQALAEPGVMIEIEVETLEELDQALTAGATRILLDNFDNTQLRQAVERTAGRAALEASGGVTLETIGSIAQTGVDYISVGQITKDVRAIDFSMLFSAPA